MIEVLGEHHYEIDIFDYKKLVIRPRIFQLCEKEWQQNKFPSWNDFEELLPEKHDPIQYGKAYNRLISLGVMLEKKITETSDKIKQEDFNWIYVYDGQDFKSYQGRKEDGPNIVALSKHTYINLENNLKIPIFAANGVDSIIMKFNYKTSNGKTYIIPRINSYAKLFDTFSQKLIHIKEIIPTIEYKCHSYFKQPEITIDPNKPEKITLKIPKFLKDKGKDLCEQLIRFYSNIVSNPVINVTLEAKPSEPPKQRVFSQNEGERSYLLCTGKNDKNQTITVDNIFDFWLIIVRNLYISNSFYLSFIEYAAPTTHKAFTIDTVAASFNDFCKIYLKSCKENDQYFLILKSILEFQKIEDLKNFKCSDECVEDYAELVHQIYSDSENVANENDRDYFIKLIKNQHTYLKSLQNAADNKFQRNYVLNVRSISNTNDGRINIELKFNEGNPWHSVKIFTKMEESGSYRLDAQLDYLPKVIEDKDLTNGNYCLYVVPTGYAIVSFDTKLAKDIQLLNNQSTPHRKIDPVVCSLLFIPKNFIACFPRDVPNSYSMFGVIYSFADNSSADITRLGDISFSKKLNSGFLNYRYKDLKNDTYIIEYGIRKIKKEDIKYQTSQSNNSDEPVELDLKSLNFKIPDDEDRKKDKDKDVDYQIITKDIEQSNKNQIKIPYGAFLSAPQSWFDIDDLKNMLFADRNMDENDFKMNILRLFPDIIPIRYFSEECSKSLTFVDSPNLDSSSLLHELTGIPFIPSISGSIFVASNYIYTEQDDMIENVEVRPVMYVKMFNGNETAEPEKVIANMILSMAFSSHIVVIRVSKNETFINGAKELLENLDYYMEIMSEYPDDEKIDMICDHIILLSETPRDLMAEMRSINSTNFKEGTLEDKLIRMLTKNIIVVNPGDKNTIKDKLEKLNSKAAKFNLYNMRESGVVFASTMFQHIKNYTTNFFQELAKTAQESSIYE